MKPFEFSHIYVIESLRSDDDKTGTELFNDVIRPNMMKRSSEQNCMLFNVTAKRDLLQILETICQKEVNPIIHFEMHGDEYGLQFTNYETISYSELQPYFLKLNETCGNNLFITMATCNGGFIFKAINPATWSPFWGFVGPFENVSNGDIIENYSAFYTEFLQSLDFNLAVDALNAANSSGQSKFHFRNTEYVFQMAYENYDLLHLTRERIEQRLEAMLPECRSNPHFVNWSDQMICDLLKYIIINDGHNLKKRIMRKFFLLDKFPEHEKYYEGLI
jgi:hypothetical protein